MYWSTGAVLSSTDISPARPIVKQTQVMFASLIYGTQYMDRLMASRKLPPWGTGALGSMLLYSV